MSAEASPEEVSCLRKDDPVKLDVLDFDIHQLRYLLF